MQETEGGMRPPPLVLLAREFRPYRARMSRVTPSDGVCNASVHLLMSAALSRSVTRKLR